MSGMTCLPFLVVGIFVVVGVCFSYLDGSAFATGDIVQQIIQYRDSTTWYTGKGLTLGDSFTYYICDVRLYTPYISGQYDDHKMYDHNNNCYTLQLNFHTKMPSQGQEIWIVQGIVQTDYTSKTDDNDLQHFLFLINADTFEIDTITGPGAALASSVRNTVFYLVQFANERDPQQLVVGDVWGTVDSFLNYDTKLVVTSQEYTTIEHNTFFYDDDNDDGVTSQDLKVHLLQYRVLGPSTFAVSLDLPFPTDSVVFDPFQFTLDAPTPMFTFDLLSY